MFSWKPFRLYVETSVLILSSCSLFLRQTMGCISLSHGSSVRHCWDTNEQWAELKCIMSKPKHSVTAARPTSPKLSSPAEWQWKRPCVEMVETRDQNSLHHWVATRRTVVGGNLCPHMVLIEWEMNVFFCMLSWRSGSFLLSQENLIYLNRTKKRWNKSQDKLTSLGFLLIPI